jgi:glycosyltransferase involved in cell wall biosynthesis
MGTENTKYKYKFTVFTPTYNRAHTLTRVYNSLANQTFKDFEWLIVDDGSTDNTGEIVNKWIKNSKFSIRYIKKQNGGKHTAINVGVKEAQGELFLIHDSDDSCVPETIERFSFHWDSIQPEDKSKFSGVTVLCKNSEGEIVGDKFSESPMDMSALEIRSQFKVEGEKWGFHKTDIFKEFPFPEFKGERFISEGLIWNRMAMKYKVRHVNEVLRIYEYSPDGLVASMLKIRLNSPIGTRLYYNELSSLPISIKLKVKAIINYCRFSFHSNISSNKIVNESSSKVLCALLITIGYVVYKIDSKKV